jgi:hypothetical protein
MSALHNSSTPSPAALQPLTALHHPSPILSHTSHPHQHDDLSNLYYSYDSDKLHQPMTQSQHDHEIDQRASTTINPLTQEQDNIEQNIIQHRRVAVHQRGSPSPQHETGGLQRCKGSKNKVTDIVRLCLVG